MEFKSLTTLTHTHTHTHTFTLSLELDSVWVPAQWTSGSRASSWHLRSAEPQTWLNLVLSQVVLDFEPLKTSSLSNEFFSYSHFIPFHAIVRTSLHLHVPCCSLSRVWACDLWISQALWAPCPALAPCLSMVAQDIHARVSCLARSRCTALAAMSCSSRTVQLTCLSARACVHLLQLFRMFTWESEIHTYLERTTWTTWIGSALSWLTSLPQTENDPNPGLLFFSCYVDLPT